MVRLLAVLMMALAGNSWGQLLFSDNFDGDAIDSSKWDVSLPFGSSSVAVQSGEFRSLNRGTIITKQEFTSPYILSGMLRHSSYYDETTFYLRSDGQRETADIYGGRTGVAISFCSNYVSYDENGNYSAGGIRINTNGQNNFAYINRTLSPGIDYSFSIHDFGYGFSVEITGFDGSPGGSPFGLIALGNHYSAGSKIALASRDNNSDISETGRTDLLEVQVSVPEPSSGSLLIAGGMLALARRRKYR